MPLQRNAKEVLFAGERLWLDPASALYLPDHATLIVSDLHLEKGSFLAQSGAPVPLYDTLDTLLQLKNLLDHYRPRQVVLLGDTFHDHQALQRLPGPERDMLVAMIADVPHWHWVAGNHDANIDLNLPGTPCQIVHIGGLSLSHEPLAGVAPLIVGHFHPKTVSRIGGHKVKGKVFIMDNNLLILPSFGSYTGGLQTNNPVFKAYFQTRPRQFLILRNKIWNLPD
ncbi:MAG: ligase-associated DNA damage response endonuclease PdeM [Sphingobacteriales bacterium]|nr:MAG: ligase-associated DNA damage response endonuclease PdeM [Sphingobacteriales bacterium]